MLLKQMADQVAKPLSLIFRKVMDSGEITMDWRGANVTPIFKKGSKVDPINYRPVSLTSISRKVLEMLIRDELVKHMVENQ
jgi:hypothetical protein